jgi:hypothetical protein
LTTERWLTLIAGTFVVGTIVLGLAVDGRWLYFTAFVGANLVQSAFSNWCPMKWLLERLGARSEPATPRAS